MSWSFEIQSECELFRVLEGVGGKGDEMPFTVAGEPQEDGFVRSPNASALLEGCTRTDYEGFEPYESDGFTTHCPLHPDKGITPAGLAVSRVLSDQAKYFCAHAKEGRKLDWEWHEIAKLPKAPHPKLENSFVNQKHEFAFDHQVYVVVVDGCAQVNGKTLLPYTLGRGSSFKIDPDCPSIVLFVWER